MTDLGTLGGTSSAGYGINATGQVTGSSNTGTVDQNGTSISHAFRYSSGVLTDLGTFGGPTSTGKSINASGQITGSADTTHVDRYGSLTSHAFLYSNGTMTDLGTLGGYRSVGNGINDGGQITGSADTGAIDPYNNAVTHAFLFKDGGMTDLGTLGGSSLNSTIDSYGYALNSLGQVTGSSSINGSLARHAFLYSNGVMTDLGTLPGGSLAYGYGINSLGQVVGKSESYAFLYTSGSGMVNLNSLINPSSGWTLAEADSISDTGFVTGYGYVMPSGVSPPGYLHAFLLQVPPPVVPVSLVFSPNPVQVGQQTTGTVTLSAPALTSTYLSVDQGDGSGTGLTFAPGQSSLQFSTAFQSASGGRTNTATATTNGVSVSGSIQINALPYTVSALAPSSVVVGGPAFTLTVTGTGFTPSSVILRNGVAAATTFVSATQLTTLIPASAIAHVGSVSINIADPGQGAGKTDYLHIQIVNPLPTLTRLSPATVNAGSGALTLTLTGTGFIPYDNGYYLPGSTVYWNGNALSIISVSPTQITASVPASSLAGAAFVPVIVSNPSPGGGTSARQTFSVTDGKPNVSALSPSSAVAGGPDFTLTLTGTSFTPTCVAQWNGTALATAYISPTQLTATVPAADITQTGTGIVSVKETSTGAVSSVSGYFSVTAPTPTLSGLSPSSAAMGGAALTLTVTGTGFMPASNYPYRSSAVLWNGQFLTTTYVSSTQLTASVPASYLATAGTAQVTVYNAGASVSTSNALPFTIVDTRPAVSAVSPASVTAGGPDFTLTVTGANYTPTCAVQWVGTPLTTTYVSSTQLTASVPASFISGAGSANITVKDTATGAVSPSVLPVTISNPMPTLSIISPQTAVAGSGALTLTVTGTGFTRYNPNYGGTTPPSTVKWNGQSLVTVLNSPTQLTATVPASLLAAAGTAQITVLNPIPGTGGNVSNALAFTITAPPDTTAPTTTASLSGTAGSNGWYKSAVQITLSAADNTGGSGGANTFYTLDGGAQTPYSTAFTITGDGTHAVTFWSVDNAGNTEATKAQTVKIDATAPTLMFGTPTPAPNAAGWNNSTVSIPYTASDATSGVASATPGSPVSFTAEGANQKQTVTVTDSAGNSAAFPTPAVSIDTTAPVTTASLSGTAGTNGGYVSPVTVTLSATDNASGAASTFYTVDGGSQQTYAAPFAISTGGTHTVAFWSVDNAGNTESVQTQTIQIDLSHFVGPVSFVFTPNPVQVGQVTRGVVTLSNPAPAGGIVVAFARDGHAGTSIVVPAGVSTVQDYEGFTSSYGGKTSTMTATANGVTVSAAVQITALPYTLLSISPSSVTLGGPDFTLTLTGTGFTPSSVALWNGIVLPTTYVSDTQLTAQIPASYIALSTIAAIYVSDATQGGGHTDYLFLTIGNPVPTITGLNPAIASAGSPAVTFTVTGTGFAPYQVNNGGFLSGSTVLWNGQTLTTVYVSPTQVRATVPASLLTSPGTAQVAVSNPEPGGGVSSALPFAVVSDTIAPTTTASVSGATVTLSATDNMNGSGVAGTFYTLDGGGQTAYSAPFTVAGEGTHTVSYWSVDNAGNTEPAHSVTVTVAPAKPTLSSLSPASATAGGPSFTLTVNGANFAATSLVKWNGTNRTTHFVSASQLTASISASDIAAVGTAQVTVTTPKVATTAALPFTMIARDTTAPTTTASPLGTAGTNGWYKSAVQITLSAADNTGGSGGANTFYTLDGGAQTPYSTAFTITGDGTHAVTFWSVDNAGNTEATKAQTVKIDATAPTLMFGTPTPAPNAAGWNNSTVSIPYTASDATSGVASATPGSPVSFTAEGANQKQTVTVTDSAGNSAAFLTPAVSIDLTAPATTATLNGVFLKLTAADALSGVATTYYKINSNPVQIYTDLILPYSFSGQTDTILYWSVDKVGNTESVHTLSLKAGKPTLAGLSPASAAAGGAAFTLTVTGSNFFQGCIVKWNGIGKTTTFVSGSTLTAAIPASDIATAGTVQVTVTMPGWATTAPLPFTVTAGVVKPVIASLSPATKKAGSATFTLTVTGTGFASNSVVKWNTTSLKTTFVSATTLTASVSASLLTTAGTAQVTVTTPSVGTSPAKPFTITP